jgi:hypothetical protein
MSQGQEGKPLRIASVVTGLIAFDQAANRFPEYGQRLSPSGPRPPRIHRQAGPASNSHEERPLGRTNWGLPFWHGYRIGLTTVEGSDRFVAGTPVRWLPDGATGYRARTALGEDRSPTKAQYDRDSIHMVIGPAQTLARGWP